MKEIDPNLAATTGGRRNPVIAGILLMLGGVFALAVMDALVKWLVNEEFNPVQLLAVRSWITLPIFILILQWRGGVSTVLTSRWPSHMLRCAIGMCAPLLFFFSLRTMPLADSVSLFFSAIFIMTALSALWLKEKVGLHRWGSIVVGFIGVLVITQPGSQAFRPEAIYVLLASLAYSVFILGGRWLSRTESTFSLVFYFQLTICLLCSPALFWLWQPMPTQIIVAMFVFAALAAIGHFSLTHAFKLAPVGVIAPYEYTAMVWAVIFGYLIWDDVPGIATVVGTVIIVASGLYIVHRETVLQAGRRIK